MQPDGFDRPLSRHPHQHGLFGDGHTLLIVGTSILVLLIAAGVSHIQLCVIYMILLMGWAISQAIRGISSTVVEFHDGGLLHRHKDDITIYRWEDIHRIYDATLSEYTTRHLLLDQPETRSNTVLEIQRSDGLALRVDRYFRKFRELYESVLSHHQDYWLPKCIEQINDGKAVDFGPLRVTDAVVSSYDASIWLDAIIEMRLERLGNIEFLVSDSNRHVRWVQLVEQSLPNRHLLKALILALQDYDD